LPEDAWLQTRFAEVSMEQTTSRIGSSSSTTRIRSAGMATDSVWPIVSQIPPIQSNQSAGETPLINQFAVLKPN
jgi:hypothetical protein